MIRKHDKKTMHDDARLTTEILKRARTAHDHDKKTMVVPD